MRLPQWKANGWLQAHQTTPSQIADLLGIVDRDLEDSMRDLSPDWQFGIAYNYNAALKLCTILLYASGYRPEKNLAHYRTLAALPHIHRPPPFDYDFNVGTTPIASNSHFFEIPVA